MICRQQSGGFAALMMKNVQQRINGYEIRTGNVVRHIVAAEADHTEILTVSGLV